MLINFYFKEKLSVSAFALQSVLSFLLVCIFSLTVGKLNKFWVGIVSWKIELKKKPTKTVERE